MRPSEEFAWMPAVRAEDERRLHVLPEYVGVRRMQQCEVAIYAFMEDLCPDYFGGMWDFYEFATPGESGSGFFMAPAMCDRYRLSCAGNYFEGDFSQEAAGIAVSLFAFSHLSMHTGWAGYASLYRALRLYSIGHPEHEVISGIID